MVRRPCKYGTSCYRRQDEHVSKFSHPGDSDYPESIRKHGGKAEFPTLKACFEFMDASGKGVIESKVLFAEFLLQLERDAGADGEGLDLEWAKLDADGIGYPSFPAFVDWAKQDGLELPLGIEEDASPAEGMECSFLGCKCKAFRPRRGGNPKFCRCGHRRVLHAAPDSHDAIAPLPKYWSSDVKSRRELPTLPEPKETQADEDPSTSAHEQDTWTWLSALFDFPVCKAPQVDREEVMAEDTVAPPPEEEPEVRDSKWIPCGQKIESAIQQIMDQSVKLQWTRDRGMGVPVPSGYTVSKVFRNENLKIWRKYCLKRAMMKQQVADAEGTKQFAAKTGAAWTELADMEEEPLDADVNEWYLWHGTSWEGANRICEEDFKQSFAGSATGTLYGPGTYFAESCTKADEYAKIISGGDHDGCYVMLLTRVCGGRVLYSEEAEPDTEALMHQVLMGEFDSMIGDREKCRGTFKEFVVFSADAAYSEYIVLYTRKPDSDAPYARDEAMFKAVTGAK
eukprot:TRINITY_DN37421_c0_g1_i1.p1 TRINITY_DN37421_c0_g1~~TRINITY_DN37421_c0_g1_i1.p1  ORF type:complete len:510 (-),score=100.45 TRINITY_DN37421_c0_g1_i1:7-1536(-)